MFRANNGVYYSEKAEPGMVPFEYEWTHKPTNKTEARTVYAFSRDAGAKLVECWNKQDPENWSYRLLETKVKPEPMTAQAMLSRATTHAPAAWRTLSNLKAPATANPDDWRKWGNDVRMACERLAYEIERQTTLYNLGRDREIEGKLK